MLKIESTKEGIKIHTSGTMPELCTDLVTVMQEIRNGFADDEEDGYIFDCFLQDLFIPMVIAGDDSEKLANICAESIVKRCMGDETEHKQD